MYGIIETELSQMSKGLSIMGGFVVIYGLISFFVKERMYLSEPLLAVTVGYCDRSTRPELGGPVFMGR